MLALVLATSTVIITPVLAEPQYQQTLYPGVTLTWTVDRRSSNNDSSQDLFHFTLQANITAWISVGFSQDGAMCRGPQKPQGPGTETNVVLYKPLDAAGAAVAEYRVVGTTADSFVPIKSTGCFGFSGSQQAAGTTMSFSRYRSNNNTIDAQIQDGQVTHVVFAVGNTNSFGAVPQVMDEIPLYLSPSTQTVVVSKELSLTWQAVPDDTAIAFQATLTSLAWY